MFCPYCGQRLEEADNFCTSCGKPQPKAAGPLFPAPQPFVDPEDSAAMDALNACDPSWPPTPPTVPFVAVAPLQEPPLPRAAAPVAPQRGGTASLVLAIVSSLLLLAVFAVLGFAPLVSTPFLGAEAGPLAAAVSAFDPALAAVGSEVASAGSLAGSALVALFEGYGAATGNIALQACLGIVLGLLAVEALMGLTGIVSALVHRCPGALLVWACALACAAALALAVAACGLDSTMGATLKATAASLFAGSGPRVTIPAHALLPTPFLLGACGASLVAAVLAAVGRRIRP